MHNSVVKLYPAADNNQIQIPIIPDWLETHFYPVTSAAVGLCVALVVILLTSSSITRIHRSGSSQARSSKLEIISDPTDAESEIIAVHGLAAESDYTWSCRNAKGQSLKRTHLLRDLLSKDFPQAKISSFEHNSMWLTDAPVKTTEDIGASLLKEVKASRSERNVPLIFVAHSLGGIIVKQALCGEGSQDILDATCGIVFLGTPHQGSPISFAAAVLSLMTRFLGSDATLLMSLRNPDLSLRDLSTRFDQRVSDRRLLVRQPFRIVSFHEEKSTFLLRWFSLGTIVTPTSAMVHADPYERHGFQTDHSGLNKFPGPEEPSYQKLKGALERLRVSSILAQADRVLQTEYYTTERLRIHRISGQYLPVDACYINLAIVEQIGTTASYENQDQKRSPNPLFARQRVDTPDKTPLVRLWTIFGPSNISDNPIFHPRRVLIRGRAGVGKTTLCKKIVHAFTKGRETRVHRVWTKLFDRVPWIPLRDLINLSPEDYEELFYRKYFVNLRESRTSHSLATELAQKLHSTQCSRTLFILDGLDEVVIHLESHSKLSEFLTRLLNNPNVIITSRPNATIPGNVKKIDLELETIGFSPRQVGKYIEVLGAENGENQHAKEAQSFLQCHWLLRSLVQIPILLDAFCYIWKDGTMDVPDTMTSIYQQIELKLWRKDLTRLEPSSASASPLRPGEIYRRFDNEIQFTELLAFSGLYSDVINFTPSHRDQIDRKFKHIPPSDDTLAKLTFMRTSDPSLKHEERNYHFIHLTFQEYFAAKHFVRQWQRCDPLVFVFKEPQNTKACPPTDPTEFLRKNKYTERLNIFWRFVAGLLVDSRLEDAEVSGIDAFFCAVRARPMDLLGQLHHRLLLDCFFEVPSKQKSNLQCRNDLEKGFTEWMIFECKALRRSSLAGKIEVPEEILLQVLLKVSEEAKLSLLQGMVGRPIIEESITNLMTQWLNDDASRALHRAILKLFHRRRGTWLGQGVPRFMEITKKNLDDTEHKVRVQAAHALRRQQGLDLDSRSTLVALLEDRYGEVALAAATTLLHHKSIDPDIIMTAFKEQKPWAMRIKYKDEYFHSGINLETIMQWLEDDGDLIQSIALGVLQRRTDLDLDTIRSWPSDGRWFIRRAAISILQQHRILERDTIVAMLGDVSSKVREAAVRALQCQHDIDLGAVSATAALHGDSSPSVRIAALETLGHHQALDLNTIKLWLKDDDYRVCKGAIQALQYQQNLDTETMSFLMTAATDHNTDVCNAAIEALGNQQDLTPEAFSAVSWQLRSDYYTTFEAAAKALQNRPALITECIEELLRHHSVYIQRRGVKLLQNHRGFELNQQAANAIVGQIMDDKRGM